MGTTFLIIGILIIIIGGIKLKRIEKVHNYNGYALTVFTMVIVGIPFIVFGLAVLIL